LTARWTTPKTHVLGYSKLIDSEHLSHIFFSSSLAKPWPVLEVRIKSFHNAPYNHGYSVIPVPETPTFANIML